MTSSTTELPAQVPAQGGPPDADGVAAFAGQMLGVLNAGMLSLMVSIGHRTGLFDVMSRLGWVDSHGLAALCGLQERYVREWLGAMVTGRVVEHDRVHDAYLLPPEHAACLTRAAAPENMAAFAQYVAMLGKVEDRVVECFRTGGGVPYDAFPEFQRLMAEDSGQVLDATLLEVTVPLVPGLHERLAQGIDVADVGCGSGHAINLLAEAYPASRFVGFDVSAEAIAAGVAEAEGRGLRNARFERVDAATLEGPGAFDLVTSFDAIHDQAHPARVLRGIHDILRPGGTYLCVDIQAASDLSGNVDHPLGPFLYTISCMHCMTVSLAADGAGLGTMWGRQLAEKMLAEAGFRDIEVHTVESDIQNYYYIARRD